MAHRKLITATLSMALLGTCVEVNAMGASDAEVIGTEVSDPKRTRRGGIEISPAQDFISERIQSIRFTNPREPLPVVKFIGMGRNQGFNWTGCPPKEVLTLSETDRDSTRTVDCPQFTMTGTFKPTDGTYSDTDPKGFQPRSIVKNSQLDPLDDARQAMPRGLPNASLSLYTDETETVLREEVVEWFNARYRYDALPEFKDVETNLFTPEGAVRFAKERGINYCTIWWWKPENYKRHLDKGYKPFAFDALGRPITPYPIGCDLNVEDTGFYFFYGENPAVDFLLTIKHEGRIYTLVQQRTDNKAPDLSVGGPNQISITGGMQDITADTMLGGGVSVAAKELKEETGYDLDITKMLSDGVIQSVSYGVVPGEERTTRNAFVTSEFFHAHFDSIDHFKAYLLGESAFDTFETARRFFADAGYILNTYIMPGAKGKTFAGGAHGDMIADAVAKLAMRDGTTMDCLSGDVEGMTFDVATKPIHDALNRALRSTETEETDR
jgi:8-oxo-dGTP pyrophosphatase MutT (NUDIX family)